MAIKAIMLRRKIKDANAKRDALLAKQAELNAREAELEQAIDEAGNDEQLAEVEAGVSELETERAANTGAIDAIDTEIEQLVAELRAEEAAQNTDPAPGAAPAASPATERKDMNAMNIETRNRFFGKMTVEQRSALFARGDVKDWLGEVRAHMQEKRALQNVGLTIPEVFIGMLRENLAGYSKLYKHVNVRSVSGEARQLVMGTIPEGVWTDCCATLNELDLGFFDLEMDCYKVGGFFAVCNATLEDSDLNLAAELLDAISQAIGLALDKAILYGRNTASRMKMPQGIVSRLAQTSEPSGYPATARPWADLHESNILTIPSTATGVELFRRFALAAGAAKGRYARGEMTWVMNEKTHTTITADALTINAAGAIVSGVDGSMPVTGGAIEELNFIPDNVIIGGYFDLYTLAERAGAKFATSEHVRFLQDQTVMKGTARYDGAPAIPDAFVVIGINGVTPTAAMAFAPDVENEPPTLSALTIGSLTLSPSFSGGVTTYAASTTNATNTVTATAANAADTVAISVNGTALTNGGSATWRAGENTVLVTVANRSGASSTYTVTVTKS